MPGKYKAGDRVALKEDTSFRGQISFVNEAQLPVNETIRYVMPTVKWDKNNGEFMYLEEALIPEKELSQK